MLTKQEKIEQIADWNYNPHRQILDLSEKEGSWSDVLLVKDWSMLEQLNLNDCNITDETLKIFSILNWPSLTFLDLRDNKLTCIGMQLLMNCNLNNLKELYLDKNLIENNGIKCLVKADLPKLERLWIGHCRIACEGIKHLVKGKWPNLNQLWLGSYEYKNKNRIQLNGWQTMGQNYFSNVQKIHLYEKEPICWMNCITMENSKIKVNIYGIDINNLRLKKQISTILYNRNLREDRE